MAGERRTILYASFLTVTYHAWQVQQHGEPRRALDQCSDGGAAKTENEITLPMPRHERSVTSTGRWLIMISVDTKFLPLRRVRALGTRSTRPVRRQAVSSRRNAPRPWTNKD